MWIWFKKNFLHFQSTLTTFENEVFKTKIIIFSFLASLVKAFGNRPSLVKCFGNLTPFNRCSDHSRDSCYFKCHSLLQVGQEKPQTAHDYSACRLSALSKMEGWMRNALQTEHFCSRVPPKMLLRCNTSSSIQQPWIPPPMDWWYVHIVTIQGLGILSFGTACTERQ